MKFPNRQVLSSAVAQRLAVVAVEVCFRDARQDAGVGQARNRVRLAVGRTVPFGMVCFSLAVVWCATCGHHRATSGEIGEARSGVEELKNVHIPTGPTSPHRLPTWR